MERAIETVVLVQERSRTIVASYGDASFGSHGEVPVPVQTLQRAIEQRRRYLWYEDEFHRTDFVEATRSCMLLVC